MKFISITFFITFLSFFGLSQERIIAENSGIDIETLRITEIAKNSVSSTMTVYTYKLNNGVISKNQENDSDIPKNNSGEVDAIINSFLSNNGVRECTFDSATQTFTILSSSDSDLSSIVENINN